MADKIVDKVMLGIIPILDQSEMQKQAKKAEKSMEEAGEKAGKNVSKGFFAGWKKNATNIKKNWKALAGVGLGLGYAFKDTTDKTRTNLEQQIATADMLGTTASQTGMKTADFAKLYTVLRAGDTESESAIKTIQEFSKRFGEYKKTGAKSEMFGGLQNQDVGKAFLEAVGIVGQEKDASKRAMLIDQMFGGEGVEKLAEFFTKDITQLMSSVKGVNFEEYGKAIESLSSQDDVVKKRRVELERQNLIRTSQLTKGQSGQFLADKDPLSKLNYYIKQI